MKLTCCLVLTLLVPACGGPEEIETTSSALSTAHPETDRIPNNLPMRDALGFSTTYSAAGHVDVRGPFFEPLGANQRTCGSCHRMDQGWSISAAATRVLFEQTRGTDPLFRTVDGSNAPDADVSTPQRRRAAYSMLLARGTLRVGVPMPAGADFELTAVDDPYGFASAAQLSLFRRPLPATNLEFITAVMWDGRIMGTSIEDALAVQADAATEGHAQREGPLEPATRDRIVAFETGLFTAQSLDRDVGPLDVEGGRGGAENLASQPSGGARWDLFDAYQSSCNPTYRAIYRGQELFNTHTRSTGVGTCQGCHSQSNVGTNVSGIFFDIGTSAGARRESDQPLYTLTEIATGTVVETTDPGRALITGKFADVDRFKVPSLRGLAARAPYFHGGSARTLADVVAFYERSLSFVFTDDEAADLVAFLQAL